MKALQFFVVPLLLAQLMACGFNPHPKNGVLPCTKGCPSGYTCGLDNRCWKGGGSLDANVGGSGEDATTTGMGGATGTAGTPAPGGVSGTIATGGITTPDGGGASGGAGGTTGLGGALGGIAAGGTTNMGGTSLLAGATSVGGTTGAGGSLGGAIIPVAGSPNLGDAGALGGSIVPADGATGGTSGLGGTTVLGGSTSRTDGAAGTTSGGTSALGGVIGSGGTGGGASGGGTTSPPPSGGAGGTSSNGGTTVGGNTSSATGGTSALGGTTATGGTITGGTAATTTGTGGSTGGTIATYPYPPGNAPVRSLGCGSPPKLTSGTKSITSSSASRQYIIDIPTDYNNENPYRVVFSFHWMGGTMTDVATGQTITKDVWAYLGLLPLDTPRNTVFIAPQGLSGGWANTDGRDEILIDDIIKTVGDNLCIDKSRIFAHGFSYGAMFVSTLSCTRNEVFRAFASQNGASSCTQKKVAFFCSGSNDGTKTTMLDQARRVARANPCADPNETMPQPAVGSASHTCTSFSGCPAAFPIRYCAFDQNHKAAPCDGCGPDQEDAYNTWMPGEVWKFFTQF